MKETLTYEDKLKRARLAVAGLEKEFGSGIVFSGNDDIVDVDSISTGNFILDLALGVGGVPTSRVTEIYGPEGAGKSLLAQEIVAAAQRRGGLAAYIDIEHALDPFWATKLGVKWSELQLSQPNYGEQALTVLRRLLDTNAYDVIIVDSIAAMTPLAELEGEIGDALVGAQARMMGQAMRILNPIIGDGDTAVVFINQIRDKIGFMANGGTTTPGGRAVKFFSSVRIELRIIGQIKNEKTGDLLGNRIQAKILKNKVAPPFKVVEYDILHGKGFNNSKMIMEMAVKYGLIAKSGAYFYKIDWTTGERAEKTFSQGMDAACVYLSENPDFRDELTTKISDEYRKRSGYFDMPEEEIEEVMDDREIGEE